MLLGGAPAGIYTTCSPTEVAYIVNHAEAKVIIVEDEEQLDKIRAEKSNLPKLKFVVLMRGTAKPSEEWVLTWDEFLAQADGTPDKAVEDAVQKLDPEGVATLIYTSGTTGPPKGVMLSHENIAWTSKIAEGLVSLRSDDCSFLIFRFRISLSRCSRSMDLSPRGVRSTLPSRSIKFPTM